ncbi:MAG: cytochrome P450, partial [Pyrinomonadaceae bacterium]
PAFHKQRIASYGAVMVAYAERMQNSERWQHGQTLDVWPEMMQLTLAIVSKTLFDADVEREAEDVTEALTAAMELFGTFMLPFMELLERLPFPAKRRFERARARLDAVIYRIIEERRQSATDRGDLLSMLLIAQDEEGDGKGMTDEQLRDEAMTIFLAGHETTANALTWTWYLLSQHPQIEAEFHREIDAAAPLDRPLTVEDLPRLRYAEMVLAESLRLYPPAWTVGRRAIGDYEEGGYHIPAGSLILLSQYVSHHDPRYFPEPFRFDPERWTPAAQKRVRHILISHLGGGPRRCIGEGFALMEGVLLLATIARRWRLRLVPGHPVATQALVTLRPKHGMMMQLERR